MITHLFAYLLLITNAHAGPEAGTVYEQSRKAVATFQWKSASDDSVLSSGTAFFLNHAIVVTNVHVAANQASENGIAVPVLRLHNGDEFSLLLAEAHKVNYDADLVAIYLSDYVLDYHLKQLEEDAAGSVEDYFDLPSIVVAKDKPKVGDDVYVIGSPKGLDQSLSAGIISSLRDVEPFGECFQTTAQISAGSSGSPAFNSSGELFGIATFKRIGGEGLNFLVPASRLLDGLEVEKPLLGWAEEVVTDEEAAAAMALYKELSASMIALAREEEFYQDPVGRKRLDAAVSNIQAGKPDQFDPRSKSPEVSSWEYILQVCQGLASVEEGVQLVEIVIAKAGYLGSTGVDDQEILRFAAAFGPKGAREKYLEVNPNDELLRWDRAVDTSIYFLKVPDAFLQLGDNEIFLDSVSARVNLLEDDLGYLVSRNVLWQKNVRFIGLQLVLNILQGDLVSALSCIELINEIDHNTSDTFFGATLFRSMVDSAVEASVLLGNSSHEDIEEFIVSVKAVGVSQECHLAQEVLVVFE